MTRHLTALLLAGALVATGCGGDDKETSGAATQPATTATAEQDPGSGDPQAQAIADQCNSIVEAQGPVLVGGIEKELKALCDKAGRGSLEDAMRVNVDICVKLVEATEPAGAARDESVKQCRSAAP